MKVVFLGTGGTIPTEKRKHPTLAFRREGEVFLLDCGEGAQSQIFKAHLGIAPIRAILVSHLHGDHVLGIPGLLMTMTQSNRSQPLLVVGPSGIAKWINHVCEDLAFHASFEIAVQEVESGPVLVCPQYQINAFFLEHSIPTLGYQFQETERPGRFRIEEAIRLGVPKGPLWRRLQSGSSVRLEGGREVYPKQVLGPPRPGLKIVYAVDTRPCRETVEAALEADLLIHDGMFLSEDIDKAHARGHSTAIEAAQVALEAKARRLALTHVSPRYRGEENRFLKQACKIFPETIVAEDIMEIELRHPDH
ncbi:MAG: ribonuclease Z [Proteobacteria bacterium]|nr:ribonuclease Z [Pseudomonadota bacterium]